MNRMGLSGRAAELGFCMVFFIMAWGTCVVPSALAAEQECAAGLPDDLLAREHFAGGIVAFRQIDQVSDEDSTIQVAWYHPDENCRPVTVDNYEFNGGLPTLEASFVYPIQGEDNLFAIVSWPLLHVGLGMNGRYYGVYAYQPAEATLALNTFVAGNPEVSSGIVGRYEGEDWNFEGTTEDGLIALMASQGKWTWQAACDVSGRQLELNACAYVEQIEAQEEIEAARQEFSELYADDPDLLAEQLERFDDAQRAWQVQLQQDLDALFPLQPGEDPSFLYGSSYPMRYAYARAFLVRQRAEFLRAYWLDGR